MEEIKKEEVQTQNGSNASAKEDMILKRLDRLQKEVWYNRLAMAVFLVVSLFYINMKTSNIANALGTFIEMFMP